MYKVIAYFTDLQDNGHPYHIGDAFPRKGVNVSKERLDELSSGRNKRKKPLIEFIAEKEPVEEPEKVVESVPDTAKEPEKPKSTKKVEKKSIGRTGTKSLKGKSTDNKSHTR